LVFPLIITGDIHLNLSNNKPFEESRFIQYMDVLYRQGKESLNAYILVLNGDIFDKAKPSPQEVKLFYKSIDRLSEVYNDIWIIPGNHENLTTDKTWYDYYPEIGYTLMHNEIIDIFGKFTIHAISHVNIKLLKEPPIVPNRTNILLSHYRSDVGVITAEVDNDIVSDKFEYAVLSDIHFHYQPRHNITYTSTPYNAHYTEKVDNGYIRLVLEDTGEYTSEFIPVDLPNKIKMVMPVSRYHKIIDTLDPRHLYKITVKGSFDELKELEGSSNVILNTIILDADEEVIEEDVTISDNSIIDFEEAIIRLTLELGGLPEDKFVPIANDILKGVS
jgi:hypothetical protein